MILDLIQDKVRAGRFRISEHAERERENDGIEIRDLHEALLSAELLEDYPDDPRGHSCLLLGTDAQGRPIHAVCGLDKTGNAILVTVYVPAPPKWMNPRERSK